MFIRHKYSSVFCKNQYFYKIVIHKMHVKNVDKILWASSSNMLRLLGTKRVLASTSLLSICFCFQLRREIVQE